MDLGDDMFEETFAHIDQHFSFNEKIYKADAWKKKISNLIVSFEKESTPHLDEIMNKFPQRLLEKSIQEYVGLSKNNISLFEYRLRPFNDYFIKSKKTIPYPSNPAGPSATGCETSFSLHRSYKAGNILFPSEISIQFQIWGQRERVAFRKFYFNYKRIIDLLLKQTDPSFFTSCVFDNLEKYRGTDTIRKLELYCRNENDPEANFSLTSQFNKNSDLSKTKLCLEIFIAIYDCCYGYLEKKCSPDRILNYLHYIKKV